MPLCPPGQCSPNPGPALRCHHLAHLTSDRHPPGPRSASPASAGWVGCRLLPNDPSCLLRPKAPPFSSRMPPLPLRKVGPPGLTALNFPLLPPHLRPQRRGLSQQPPPRRKQRSSSLSILEICVPPLPLLSQNPLEKGRPAPSPSLSSPTVGLRPQPAPRAPGPPGARHQLAARPQTPRGAASWRSLSARCLPHQPQGALQVSLKVLWARIPPSTKDTPWH